MRIEFASPYEYWQSVANNVSGRLFIPTTEVLDIGKRVELHLSIAGHEGAAEVSAVVVGRRQGLGRLPGGLMVRLGPSEVTEARAFLGIDAAIPEYERLRAHRRFRCALPLRFVRPALSDLAMAVNLSEGGMLSNGASGFVKGDHLEVSLETSEGALVIEAEVQWHLGKSAGLRFLSMTPGVSERLKGLIETLRQREQSAKVNAVDPLWLVADRDASACQRMAKLLSTLGARTLAVHDGRELVSLARALRPDLIFVDVLLHGIDGPQACRQLRSEQDVPDTPLVLTGQMEEHALAELSLHEGANDFLSKPAQVKDVAAVMRRIFGFSNNERSNVRA